MRSECPPYVYPPSPRLRKVRLYADEDIEERLIVALRARKFNVLSARELGHQGKPDEFHAALAYHQRRFLVTKNGKDFLGRGVATRSATHGVIVIEVDSHLWSYCETVVDRISWVVPRGGHFEGTAIRITTSTVDVRGRDVTGQQAKIS